MRCYPRRFVARLCCVLLFFSSLLFCLGFGQLSLSAQQMQEVTAISTASLAQQQVQQGVTTYKAGDYIGAIKQWQKALDIYTNEGDALKIAIVEENLARAYQQTGQIKLAIKAWQQSIDRHRQVGDSTKVGRLLTELAQAYSQLGQYRQAITLLCNAELEAKTCISESALGIAQSTGDHLGETAALGGLGNAHRQRGAYEVAITYLEQGLTLGKTLEPRIYLASTLNSLGNAHVSRALLKYRRARSFRKSGYVRQADALTKEARADDSFGLQYFQDSLATSSQDSHRIRALLNEIPIYYRRGDSFLGIAAHQQATRILSTLP